jgi:hypothetical protein
VQLVICANNGGLTLLAQKGVVILRKMNIFLLILIIIIFNNLWALPRATTHNEPVFVKSVKVVVENLNNPVGITVLMDNTLLVTLHGSQNQDAGVIAVWPDGTQQRLVNGLPSARLSTDFSGTNFIKVSNDGSLVYIGTANVGHLLTTELDQLLSREPVLELTDLTPFMLPSNENSLINPFDSVTDRSNVIYVTDSSRNAIALANEADEADEADFFHIFERIPLGDGSDITVDPVPTGITLVKDTLYITLTGGCPRTTANGRLVSLNRSHGEIILLEDLHMPIDVIQSRSGVMWILEFATVDPEIKCDNEGHYLANSGRLSYIDKFGSVVPVITSLNFPTSIAESAHTDIFFVSQLIDGNILEVSMSNIEPSKATSDRIK